MYARDARNRRLLFASALLFLLHFAAPVGADPIPVGATPSDNLIFNFDFTGANPPPPYDSIRLDLLLFDLDSTEGISFDFYRGLDGLGGISLSAGPLFFPGVDNQNVTFQVIVNGIASAGLGLEDGVFSFGIRISEGDVDLKTITGTAATIEGIPTQPIIPTVSAPIPEPGTLVLLLMGLTLLIARARLSRVREQRP